MFREARDVPGGVRIFSVSTLPQSFIRGIRRAAVEMYLVCIDEIVEIVLKRIIGIYE